MESQQPALCRVFVRLGKHHVGVGQVPEALLRVVAHNQFRTAVLRPGKRDLDLAHVLVPSVLHEFVDRKPFAPALQHLAHAFQVNIEPVFASHIASLFLAFRLRRFDKMV
jgi:hypothetical protein